MGGFRSLGDDEEVEFKAVKSDKGLEAVEVRSSAGGDCKGSNRRPGAKKKHKKVRYQSLFDTFCHVERHLMSRIYGYEYLPLLDATIAENSQIILHPNVVWVQCQNAVIIANLKTI